MTVYGGEKTDWGTRNGGFFVTCTRCGWHSKVAVIPDFCGNGLPITVFLCKQCDNKYTLEGRKLKNAYG